jgi:hypothetical protein
MYTVWLVLVILTLIAQVLTAAWLAERNGRSVFGWVVLILFTHLIGLAVLAVLPRLRLTCPQCAHEYRRGATVCAACGVALPSEDAADRLTFGERYDQQCPNCDAPYREDDYQPDAEHIYCSTCRQEVPRRPLNPEPSGA